MQMQTSTSQRAVRQRPTGMSLESCAMHIHILGICGTFMGGLAALAREAGHTVTGCDAGVYPPMSDQLRALGIELIEGYGAEQTALRPDLYVVGNVVSRRRDEAGQPRFPLMEAILDQGLPYTSGPQWLGEHILQGRHVLAVAGTHGKTTTTAMLAWILECAGRSPGFLVGGVPLDFGVSARLGTTPVQGRGLFVIEADEYDTAFFDKRSKFVHYRPRTAILNNLEYDHADIFDDLAAIERQFHHLLRTVPASGCVVSNAQSAAIARVLQQGCYSEVLTFGSAALGAACDFSAHGTALAASHEDASGEVWETFDVCKSGRPVAQVCWTLAGMHNRMNALAAIAAASHVGVNVETAAKALRSFRSVRRRMELRGSVGMGVSRIAVYDDFAHHPTAIAATLGALRQRVGQHSRILAVFEPRSNTMKLGTMAAQLPAALQEADVVFCHAGGLDWDAAAALAPLGAAAYVAPNVDSLLQQICAQVRPGDHILCMSNGSFGGIHTRLLQTLQAQVA